ncbi:unnamed protein product [Hermetia illucens]|uniref:Malate dehydrogenase, mitochondrial n=2 Tax=Hermetia illucens TaxID=343691 RepID=A0A7R8UU66_HERIL|nr:unnamed protein product [Hermetia illucens]
MELALHDISPNLSNITRQLNCISTRNTVEGFLGPMRMRAALKDADIVIVLVRARHYSKTSNSDSFEQNFPIIATIVKTCIEVSPQAILAIGTNPLNCVIPAVEEIYKNFDIWYANKIIGITAADSMQACSVYADMYSLDPNDVFVPITGGTTVDTILPLFSQSRPAPHKTFSREEAEKLTSLFLESKSQEGVSELSSAFAIYCFIESLVRALNGEKDIVECAFVASSANPPLKYTTSLIDLTEEGVANVYGLPTSISRYERKQLQTAMNNLQRDITMVEKYLTTANYQIKDTKLKFV